jgi:putative photosynthetic complex assembly protein
MSHTHVEKIPKAALIGAAGLIAISILSAFAARVVGTPSQVPEGKAVIARDLRFADRTDGGVDVWDVGTQSPVTVISPGSNAFIRATVRGLAQQRKRESKTDDVPFRLTAWEDGRLTIDDPATGRHVELEAFGQTNAAAFASLLQPEGAHP